MTTSQTSRGQPLAVPPTLTATVAATIDWHCIVIGAGPAGSAVAIRLAQAGQRVLLVDRSSMPRPKVCGCCLSPLAIAELRGLCPPGAVRSPLPLEGVCLLSAGRSARVPMAGGGILSRETLDASLVRRAIDVGADWLPDMLVEAIHDEGAARGAATRDDGEVVVLAHRATPEEPRATSLLRGRVAVIAAGLADTIRIVTGTVTTTRSRQPAARRTDASRGRRVAPGSRIGLGATLDSASLRDAAAVINPPPGELVMAVAPHGYCGIVGLEDGRLDLAAAVDRRLIARAGGPAAAITQLLRTAGGDHLGSIGFDRVLEAVAAATFRATPPLTHQSPLLGSPSRRILRVGDAAGYVEPFTGEGMGWALASGRILAESLLIDPGSGNLVADASRYEHQHERLFAGHHARCLRVARGVRHPTVVSAAVRLAAAMPRAAAWALPLVTGASGRS